MGLWTTAGLNLIATAIQTPLVNTAITYVGIGTGAGTLATGITGGTPITSLSLDVGIPVALSSGQALTITDGSNTDTCVVASGGATLGVTTILVNSFTPVSTYAVHVTGVVPTPLATDLTLYNETARVGANLGNAGANPGESINGGYFDGTQVTAIYMQVGYFGGSTATATVATGTLMIEDIQFWNHTVNADSNMFSADDTI